MTITDAALSEAAALQAAEDPMGPDADAPYGYMIDTATGERRPKIKPGKQRAVRGAPSAAPPPFKAPPSVEELKAAGSRPERGRDSAPGADPRTGKAGRAKEEFDASALPPFRAGPIAKGVNKLYIRFGKVVRVASPIMGQAIIMCATKESDDDVTVGDAWEDLAKGNPRIRAMLMRMITGGAWAQLVMAHAPIMMAVLTSPRVASRFPLARFLEAWFSSAEDAGEEPYFGGLTPEDMDAAMRMAASMMGNTAAAAGMGVSWPPNFGPAPGRGAPGPVRAPQVEVVDGELVEDDR